MRALGGIGVAFALLTGAANAERVDLTKATSGYTYFNRAGADMIAHNADLETCARAALPDRDFPNLMGGLFWEAVASARQGTMVRANIENCMVVHGWRVVRVPEAEGVALAGLKQPELASRLAAWVGAERPNGEIVRSWDNDAAKLDTIRSGMPRVFGAATSLSISALPPVAEQRKISPPSKKGPDLMSLYIQPIELNQIDRAAPGAGVVVFTLRTRGAKNLPLTIFFERSGPTPGTPAWRDGKPTIFSGAMKDRAPEGQVAEATFAVAVPPGKWRLGGNDDMVSYCMGAPSFTISAGEVVYLGAFDYSAPKFEPELSLDAARAALNDAPIAREKLRAAVWTNGATGKCDPIGYNYALEFPGVPFETGYTLGSAAQKQVDQARVP